MCAARKVCRVWRRSMVRPAGVERNGVEARGLDLFQEVAPYAGSEERELVRSRDAASYTGMRQ